jgi:hypothetical protein
MSATNLTAAERPPYRRKMPGGRLEPGGGRASGGGLGPGGAPAGVGLSRARSAETIRFTLASVIVLRTSTHFSRRRAREVSLGRRRLPRPLCHDFATLPWTRGDFRGRPGTPQTPTGGPARVREPPVRMTKSRACAQSPPGASRDPRAPYRRRGPSRRSIHGTAFCARCHPPAFPHLVREWLGPE